ncbi:MAG: tetraether lipid synthase Tes [archaeon]
MRVLDNTMSLCPTCLKHIPAKIFEEDNKVWMEKECKEHGKIKDLYWGDYELYERAKSFASDGKNIENPNVKFDGKNCPFECGLCSRHKSHTCLANIVVTNRCNLKCWYCFFYCKDVNKVYEPSMEQLREMVRTLRAQKPIANNAVQLTGGEPLLRPDIIEVIKMIKAEGIEHLQLNTSGIVFIEKPGLAKKCKTAGINTVYLSFDGTSKKTNQKNHWEIKKILNECHKAGLGVVLVPTIIKTINDQDIYNIIKFAFDNVKVVRGVNFQPVSLVGLMPRKEREKQRITVPDVIINLEKQSKGKISRNSFYPVPSVSSITHLVEALSGKPQYELSSHFACGMATYVFKEKDKLIPITEFVDVDAFFNYTDKIAKEINHSKLDFQKKLKLLLNLKRFVNDKKKPKHLNLVNILYNILTRKNYSALGALHHNSLFIGIMHFQDLYNYDVKRVERCTIHYAVPGKKVLPFCAFNVLPEFYREKTQAEHYISMEELKKRYGVEIKDYNYKRSPETIKNSPESWV